MSKTVKFYWDIGSTNTYFAFHLLRQLAEKYDLVVEYEPLNLGYVFRHHNYVLMQEPKAKLINRKIDLQRWADKYELKFSMPSEFPIKTSRALRGAIVMREYGLEEAYMEDIFARYWEQNDASIAEYAGLAKTVAGLGIDVDTFVDKAESDSVRQKNVEATDKALANGVFGAPTMELDGELYWGKDRFDFIEDQLKRDL